MIQVCSRHVGTIHLTLPDDRRASVVFQDVSHKGGPARGLAEVDEAVAEVLLGKIGLPDYWRPGQLDGAQGGAEPQIPLAPPQQSGEQTPPADDGDPPQALSIDSYDGLPNVAALEDALEACDDRGLIMELVAREAQREKTRESWMKALNRRLEALG